MLTAANNLEFEKAALLRDQIRELKNRFGNDPADTNLAKRPTVSYSKSRKKRS
jgi:excinuclease ABC subunit B